PFHTMKPNQDGTFVMQDRSIMVISDHTGPGLMWIDWKERRVVGETILGHQPFHTTYDPAGDRPLTTTNGAGMRNVIHIQTRAGRSRTRSAAKFARRPDSISRSGRSSKRAKGFAGSASSSSTHTA